MENKKRMTSIELEDGQREAIEQASGKPGKPGALITGILNLLAFWDRAGRPEAER